MNKEQKAKPTPTPGMWEHLWLNNSNDLTIFSPNIGLVSEIDNKGAFDTNAANANLIVSAVNACKSINPDNPLAVAEGMKEVVDALQLAKWRLLELRSIFTDLRFTDRHGNADKITETLNKAQAALSKIQGKEAAE